MQFIAHRINQSKDLSAIPAQFGVEIDLRDQGTDVIVVHDPFSQGEKFEDWLSSYAHNTLILNVKSERIEIEIRKMMAERHLSNYFFLDSSFPMIVNLGKSGETRQALRFSEYEGLQNFSLLREYCTWAWIDCFSRLVLTADVLKDLREMGYKVCLVSPELQGRPQDIVPYRDYLLDKGLKVDAVCSKVFNYELWKPYLEG